MTAQGKTYLKTRFATGAYPVGQDFSDLIDSLQRQAVVDVRDYGAVGDGNTDDYAALQAAIDAVAATGGVVRIPDKSYKCNTGLSFNTANTILTGNGEIVFGNVVGISVNAAGCKVEGVKLTGANLNSQAIHLYAGADRFSVRNTIISGFRYGILSSNDNQTGIEIVGNTLSAIDDRGIYMLGVSNVDISGNNLSQCGIEPLTAGYAGYAISATLCDGVIIRANRIAPGSGTYASGDFRSGVIALQSTRVTTVSNIIQSWTNGVYYEGVARGLIAGNIVQCLHEDNAIEVKSPSSTYPVYDLIICDNVVAGNPGSTQYGGITLGSTSTGYIRYCHVSNNTVRDCGYNGIALQGDTNTNLIESNICYNNGRTGAGYAGVYLSGTSNSNKIRDNLLFDDGVATQDYGIKIEATVSGTVLEDNEFITNHVAAVSDSGSGTVFRDNVGYITRKHGITGGVADGGTISHGLAVTPTLVMVTCLRTDTICNVTAIGATTFTVALKKDDGTAQVDSIVMWDAML